MGNFISLIKSLTYLFTNSNIFHISTWKISEQNTGPQRHF